MNALDLLIGPVPNALCAMFEYGILPCEEDFLELTPEQYRNYIETFGDVNEKVYMIVSQHDPSLSVGESNDIYCLTEFEKKGFMKAISIIEKYCEGQNFITDEQKLKFAASKLPEQFSRGTKYAAFHNMKVATPAPNLSLTSMIGIIPDFTEEELKNDERLEPYSQPLTSRLNFSPNPLVN